MGPKGLSPELFNHNEAFILSIFFDSSGLLQQVGTNALEREFFVLQGVKGDEDIVLWSSNIGFQVEESNVNLNQLFFKEFLWYSDSDE